MGRSKSNLTYPDRRGQKGSPLLPHINGAIEVFIPALIIFLRSMTSIWEARTTPRYEKSSGGERLNRINLFTPGTLSVSSSCFVVQFSTTLSYLLCTRCQKPGVLGTLAQLEAQERNSYLQTKGPTPDFGKERQKKFHFGELLLAWNSLLPQLRRKKGPRISSPTIKWRIPHDKANPLIELKAHLWYPAQ